MKKIILATLAALVLGIGLGAFMIYLSENKENVAIEETETKNEQGETQ